MSLVGFTRSCARGVLIGAIVLWSSMTVAQESPFGALQGNWKGGGTLTTREGRNETIRCRARYFVSPSGRDLDQHLRCASDSYLFNVISGVVLRRSGSIAGVWTETTRHVQGSVRGRFIGDSMVVNISAPGFTAAMTLTTRRDSQIVRIVPTSGDVASVDIHMRR